MSEKMTVEFEFNIGTRVHLNGIDIIGTVIANYVSEGNVKEASVSYVDKNGVKRVAWFKENEIGDVTK